MSTFWSGWVIILTLIFLAIMIVVVAYYWKKNSAANANRTVDSFDGIDENDAGVPNLLLLSYLLAFIIAAVFLVLYPGMGNWQGLMKWQSSSEAASTSPTSLAKQISQVPNGDTSFQALSTSPEVVVAGRALFQTHCAACHLNQAQGQLHFPNLSDAVWLYGGSDEAIHHSIVKGRNGVMAGWKDILTEEEIENVSYYVASLEKNRIISEPAVKLELGKTVFDANCTACHGSNAKGNTAIGAPNLTDNIWLHDGSVEGIISTVKYGLNNLMPAFEEQLSDSEIQALGAYIRHQGNRQNEKLAALDPDMVSKGQYLAYAGDCIACHTGEGGEPFGGGLGFLTPFGTLYSTNISAHPTYGIGDYTYDEFYDALHKGKGKHGYLYPAMPYSSYQYVTDEDTQALWAYMQSLNFVNTRNEENKMMFPSNIRLGLLGWNIAFLNTDPLQYPADATEQWKRGKYLTMGLGHCSECHTPRNVAQALIEKELFQGNLIDGWKAPNITATELYQDRWDVKTLTDFLKTGHSDKGTAFGGMAEVVQNSTRFLTEQDVAAISEYLITGDKYNELDRSVPQLNPPGFGDLVPANVDIQTVELKPLSSNDPENEAKLYGLYVQTCGACHGKDGKGRKGIAPTLLNNGIIMHSDPYDTIAVTIRGLTPNFMEQDSNFMPMSSFNSVISDANLAKLISFVRNKLGDRTVPVTLEEVAGVRRDLIKGGYAGNIHATTTPEQNQPNSVIE
ncbi:cytochrome-c oxidase, cbb3-type subunit III [Photobacterium angustum]|uniref:cytochrome-c oxidase, cbb3-type subunit III n=1 Tax=Photobacterium angustum TaxID=661 RepID=UPI0005E74F92|nr:cytochrome-c oxidase, cbb3-type subunit III [Photobacterium angustum]KJG15986.1 cytochrome C [Photobacterium angustum]KJG31020.1 cytochrome C [Photobacterium angustum]PSW95496.1 cytochrome-c oxidase, cbb3-type subunit III [Photobacterium angustum]PSX01181.1 cytochrome-c oxidase, cbb3-type subunit III [Photobacterium angustum]PSX37004.1 cytochrome-c oxidase, cbb3-type subunit III [Photobacterium angustum]